MTTWIGKQIEQYRIDALLGEGGMGSVFRATDLSLERPAALKVMHSQYARQETFRQRFLQEARSAARLSHPSIVDIYGFRSQEGLLYIAMEFVPGGTLDGRLRAARQQGRPISLSEALAILAQVADALD